MAIYKAPLRDMRFVLHELLEAERAFAQWPGGEEASADLIDHVLEEAGRLCEQVIFPTNRPGDEEGCKLVGGEVTTPAGFKAAYRALTQGGWTSLACDPAYGGQGLPETLHIAVQEMLNSANMAFNLYPMLTHGAYLALEAYADETLKRTYLPKMVDGTWGGSMCLTEPHSGTDLGLVRTRAEPAGDGSYRVTGTKIFITAGEHDLTENIVHLVLARLPDAPPGIKGISLFLVPKFLVEADGSLGARNAVACGSLEHKMGIRGAATCVMNFEGAVGHLVGEPHRGMRNMFTMMNHERLAVGIEGLGLAEVAYQSAADYARERLQGRAPRGPVAPDKPADPIIEHPDVRRMLLSVRAFTEGARALAGWVGLQIDRSEKHPDAAVRARAEDLVALMTPVVKAYFTDAGLEACITCQQVFGGHGYIVEHGMEQLVRDARIAQIYEGTNGVQAMDLVGRKLPMHGGRLTAALFDEMEVFLAAHRDAAALAEFTRPLAEAVARLGRVTDWLRARSEEDRAEAGAAAVDYLKLMGLTAFAYMWARMAALALPKVEEGAQAAFYRAKLATARFFMARVLPQTVALEAAVSSGAGVLLDLDAAAF